MAEYVPMHVRNSAAYSRLRLVCTVIPMIKPAMAMRSGTAAYRSRCLLQSLRMATSMQNTNALAQGGTDRSCVWMES